MWVMADRGFKHMEVYSRKMGVLLVQPPSVVSGAKLSKPQAKAQNKYEFTLSG